MGLKMMCLLLSLVLAMGNMYIPEEKKSVRKEAEGEEENIREKKPKKDAGDQNTDDTAITMFETTKGVWDEKYVQESGYFYIYVRKQGDSPEHGHWYRINKIGRASCRERV